MRRGSSGQTAAVSNTRQHRAGHAQGQQGPADQDLLAGVPVGGQAGHVRATAGSAALVINKKSQAIDEAMQIARMILAPDRYPTQLEKAGSYWFPIMKNYLTLPFFTQDAWNKEVTENIVPWTLAATPIRASRRSTTTSRSARPMTCCRRSSSRGSPPRRRSRSWRTRRRQGQGEVQDVATEMRDAGERDDRTVRFAGDSGMTGHPATHDGRRPWRRALDGGAEQAADPSRRRCGARALVARQRRFGYPLLLPAAVLILVLVGVPVPERALAELSQETARRAGRAVDRTAELLTPAAGSRASGRR